ncbi:MAG: hypothetical protein HN897_05870 [Actinobacteria bacterium]|jgi:hypothetical protein|nr:hypothetical protein [Actinomycetota bacterium]
MLHFTKCADAQLHDLMAGLAAQMADKVDPTSIVFESRVIEPLGGGEVKVLLAVLKNNRSPGWILKGSLPVEHR